MKLLWLGLLAVAAQAQTVDGVVGNSITGAPVAGVAVNIAGRKVTTDSQGAFRVETLPPGGYTAEFSKTGFLTRRERAVVSGSPLRLDVRLIPLATVSGRVLGPEGKPVPKAPVQLFITGFLEGHDEATDEQGVFTIRNVRPGAYTLSARPPKSFPLPPADDGRPRVWTRTYYPGVEHADSATKLAITPGAELFGQDISLRAVPARRLHGRVLNASGEPVAGVSVKIIPDGELLLREVEQETKTDEKGAFDFAGLYDGGWNAEVEMSNPKAAAHVRFRVAGDVERLDVRLTPSFDLTGKLVLEPGAPVPHVGVMLMPPGSGSQMYSGGFQDSGDFRVAGVSEGAYLVRVPGIMPPDYVASVRLGDREVLGDAVEISSGALPLTVTLRRDGGAVRGTVEECNGGAVVLVPQDPHYMLLDFVRRVTCRPDGGFDIAAIRPGEYYAYAFGDPPGPLEYGHLTIAPTTNLAVRVTVRPNEATQVNLKVSPRP